MITAAIRKIRGQIILEGESGLGKTMFLKHLARDYDGLVVFLRAIDCELFSNELTALAQHKMVVPFQNREGDPTSSPHWTFRHDRIRDFFLVKAFLGVGNVRPKLHLGDVRLRGVYLQLVNILPVDAAESLERMLIDYAADTRDHTVSDDFVQLLRVRKAA
jgi:hypothetical protein